VGQLAWLVAVAMNKTMQVKEVVIFIERIMDGSREALFMENPGLANAREVPASFRLAVIPGATNFPL
jgi:hypothetical protein